MHCVCIDSGVVTAVDRNVKAVVDDVDWGSGLATNYVALSDIVGSLTKARVSGCLVHARFFALTRVDRCTQLVVLKVMGLKNEVSFWVCIRSGHFGD